ncbi:MAG: serine/threonine-protein kinase [Polyangiaceae bacterium]
MKGRPAPELTLGTVIDGRYEINALLGQGGMGDVYRARHMGLDTQVALKVLQRSLASDDEQARRFSREAMACSRLKHPNTIRVSDFGRASTGHLYLVMELLEGRTLSQVLKREAPLPAARVARIALQITKSVSEAHEVGLVHRDLKPANLFLCEIHGESDFVKVLDFGIAKFMQPDAVGATLTRADLVVGTPLYLSPEQASLKAVTPRSDLYSLGVIMYHMVSGDVPFRGDSAMALLLKHIEERPARFEDKAGISVPEPLASLIYQLLEKDPERRPESARAVGLRLQEFLDDSQRAERAPVSSPRKVAPEEPEELALDQEDDDLDLTGLGEDDAPGAAPEIPRPAAPAARPPPEPEPVQSAPSSNRISPYSSTAPEGKSPAPPPVAAAAAPSAAALAPSAAAAAPSAALLSAPGPSEGVRLPTWLVLLLAVAIALITAVVLMLLRR